MDFIYFNFDLSIVSLFIGILNDKKNQMRVARCFSLTFYFSHPKIPTVSNIFHECRVEALLQLREGLDVDSESLRSFPSYLFTRYLHDDKTTR